MKVTIVGGGVMGEAILRGALDRGVFAAADATVCELVPERRQQLADAYGVAVTADASGASAGADLTLLAVKPQEFTKVGGKPAAGSLLMSIMAGVRIDALASHFGHDRIVRVMPNTPAAIGEGMSAWVATPAVSAEQRQLARSLLGAIGRELEVESETKLDMATAVGGSGPAYAFLFIEAMIEGAVAVGLTRAQAEEMVLQTVYGAAAYARESGRPAAELRAMVTSPAGTTAAALSELERAAFRSAIGAAIEAAFRRAQELGQG